MNAKIKYKIGKKNYEKIRDQVCALLTVELASQATNYYNEDAEDVEVYNQRMTPIDKTELTMVNVKIGQGTFDNHTQGSMDGTYRIYVGITTNSKWLGEEMPDTLSSHKNQRVSGIVNAILSDPAYKTLGFPPGFIERVRVLAFETDPTSEVNDAISTFHTTLLLEVKSYEDVTLPEGLPLLGDYTTVYFTNTGKGYQYVFGQDEPPPPLNPRYVYITDQNGNTLQLVEGGNRYTVTVIKRLIDTIISNQTTVVDNIINE